MKIDRKAPWFDILFGIGATLEAAGEYVGYGITKNPDLLQMAQDSGWTAGLSIGKGLLSYFIGLEKDEGFSNPNVNKTGIVLNTSFGVSNEIARNLLGRQSKSIAYNAFTAQCLLSTAANATELYHRKE